MIRTPGFYMARIAPPPAPLTVRFEGGRFVSDDRALMEKLYAARDHKAFVDAQLQFDRDGFCALVTAPPGTSYKLVTPDGELTVYVDIHPSWLSGSMSVVDPRVVV